MCDLINVNIGVVQISPIKRFQVGSTKEASEAAPLFEAAEL